MVTTLEDEADGAAVWPADPNLPPLFYVESTEQPGVYYRSLKIPDDAFPHYRSPIPMWMKHIFALDPTPILLAAGFVSAPRLFFYSASQPLPPKFVMPLIRDRHKSFYLSLTHDQSLVNLRYIPLGAKCGRAAQRVFRTPELMKKIFLQLDVATILTSIQRVSKTFKEVIDGSLALQRKLYFKPHPDAETVLHPQAKYNKDDRAEFPILNSLLVKHFGSCFFNFGSVYGWLRRAESFYENKWTPHRHRLKKANMTIGNQKVCSSVCPKLDNLEVEQAMKDRDRFIRAGASWRKMLVCQPPIYDFGAVICQPVRPHEPLPQQMETAIIKAEDEDHGLCMGQLYDFVQERAGRKPLDSVWFRLTWFDSQAPFTSKLSQNTISEWFMGGVPVVVEMLYKQDVVLPNHPPDRPKFGTFDENFKCKDFKPHKWVPDDTVLDSNEPECDPASALADRD